MIPIFTSHYSIGKSILTLGSPGDNKEGASDSIFDIAKENNLDKIVLVENSLTGFPQALSISIENKIDLVFGLVFLCEEQKHKVIVFANNSEGCKKLNLIFSQKDPETNSITLVKLKENWSEDLTMAVPFYDSFLCKNLMEFENCTPNLKYFKPTFFLEYNSLPFDSVIRSKVLEYSNANNFKTEEVKSVKYKNKKDIESFQAYQCICSRKFGQSSLSNPRLDHFGSDEFCFESFKENQLQPF